MSELLEVNKVVQCVKEHSNSDLVLVDTTGSLLFLEVYFKDQNRRTIFTVGLGEGNILINYIHRWFDEESVFYACGYTVCQSEQEVLDCLGDFLSSAYLEAEEQTKANR